MMALPSGFRFQPTDQELLVCYLRRKIHNLPLPCNVIKEIELRNHDPWEIFGQMGVTLYLQKEEKPEEEEN
ncbi:hypothetical protein AAC387_Pa02g3810 [Persea americana]